MKRENHTRNLINPSHFISERQGALSLVRKLGADHAYLVLERLNRDGKRCIVDAHLVIKKGTEKQPRPLGHVIYRAITLGDLMKLSMDCHSVTWGVSEDQMETFDEIVKAQQKQAAEDKIEYVVFGKAAAAGSSGASLEQFHSKVLKDWSVAHKKGSVSDYLLRKGHNCFSWAVAVVLNVGGLKPPQEGFSKCVVRKPYSAVKGTKDGDADQPTTKCLTM